MGWLSITHNSTTHNPTAHNRLVPLIKNSSYKNPPRLQFNGHLQTIIPGAFRKVTGVSYERERLILSDGDFVDLDWIDKGSRKLVLLSHGLEGDSNRQYMKGMAKLFAQNNWDVLAWHCRSCSGEMNLKLRLYNHGEIGDIGEVIQHALKTKDYEKVAMIGFSMGGNISMKYLGVHGKEVPDPIQCCIAYSSPCDLKSGAEILNKSENWIYRKRFMNYLKKKVTLKAQQFPGVVDLENLKKVKVWRDFDEFFSAPINGYKNAEDFYAQASAKNFMSGITIPTLLVNAQNDPILTPACSPKALCENHPHIYLENPKEGGHVGFMQAHKPFAWSEYRALDFANSVLKN